MAAVCPSHDDPLCHLQRAVAVPVLLPALHAHQGRPLLHHRSLPDPGRAVRDERRCHLHSEAHGLAASLGKHLLRLRLHPGLAGLPPGPGQRHRLCHPAEARVTPRDVAAKRKRKLNQKKKKKESTLPPKSNPTDPQRKHSKGSLLIEDVYSIYGLKNLFITLFTYMYIVLFASVDHVLF
uniref:Peripheral myelin protein 22 n=1 Tax=Serinus canaria TaxID=9135 RepID=A0A8C9MJV7_SERCA